MSQFILSVEKTGIAAARRFALYKSAKTIKEARSLGAIGKDLTFDATRGFLQLGNERPAVAPCYSVHQSRGCKKTPPPNKRPNSAVEGEIGWGVSSQGVQLVSRHPHLKDAGPSQTQDATDHDVASITPSSIMPSCPPMESTTLVFVITLEDEEGHRRIGNFQKALGIAALEA